MGPKHKEANSHKSFGLFDEVPAQEEQVCRWRPWRMGDIENVGDDDEVVDFAIYPFSYPNRPKDWGADARTQTSVVFQRTNDDDNLNR